MPNQIKIDFWNVGQGDASTILLQDGSFDVIDIGNHTNQLVYFFQQKRKCVINKLIMTHNDADHCGALKSLLENQTLTIRNLYFLDDGKTDKLPLKMIARAIGFANCRRLEITTEPEQTLDTIGAYKLVIRYPSFGANLHARSANETSAIIALTKDDKDIVIWGADNKIKTIIKHLNSFTELLVGPHHGSSGVKTAQISTSISAISPSKCLLSFGSNNGYGHPQPEYIKALNAADVHVICIQKAHQCSPGNKKPIFNGDAFYALFQPEKGIPCHGHVRMLLNDAILKDECDAEYQAKLQDISKRLCIRKTVA